MTLIAFTRPSAHLRSSIESAESMGFEVLAARSMDILPGDSTEFDRLRQDLSKGSIGVAIFASVTAVDMCRSHFDEMEPMFENVRIVSIGEATARSLNVLGIDSEVPSEFSSEGLVDHLGSSVKGCNVALIRSDRGSETLGNGLKELGAVVSEYHVYRLMPADQNDDLRRILDACSEGKVDVICLTSPLSARSFLDSSIKYLGKEETDKIMKGTTLAAIGSPTARELDVAGYKVSIIPSKASFGDMLSAIKDYFNDMESKQ